MTIAKSYQPYLSLPGRFGKEVLFNNPNFMSGDILNFSSSLEKIGTEWDCTLKNNTLVTIISEPVQIQRSQYGGAFSVTLIRTRMGKEMWVPTMCLQEKP